MDWERVNVWTSTLYTLIHSLHMAREQHFGDVASLDARARDAHFWVVPDCSYGSVLLTHPGGRKALTFRRDPSKHFEDTSKQVIKMLIQDLVVILDEMMDEALADRRETAGKYPQSKVEKLKKALDPRYHWSAHGCLELVAVRNVLTHNGGQWNEPSIRIIESFAAPVPPVGEPLRIGFSMLFRYRKAMRTLLNQVSRA